MSRHPILESGRGERVLLDPRVDEAALAMSKRDKGTPMVQLAYPRKGIWSGANQLGVELPFNPPSSAGPEGDMVTIFKMDEWGFPEDWTISLGLRIENPLPVGTIFDAIGNLSFGAGGITQTFEVDWVQGTILTLPMNAINVKARFNDLGAFFGFAVPEGVHLSVIAARGATRHCRATRTIFLNIPAGVAPMFSPVFEVPKFAKSVNILPASAADAAIIFSAAFRFHFRANSDPASTDVAVIPGTFLPPTIAGKVQIPAFAHYFTVENTGGAATQGSAVFGLFEE